VPKNSYGKVLKRELRARYRRPMRIVIAGGHGKIALILERLLSAARGLVAGFIRNPEHAADLEAAGAERWSSTSKPRRSTTSRAHLRGADAVVFARRRGSGQRRGAKRHRRPRRGDPARGRGEAAKVSRYVMISAMGADAEAPDDAGDPVFVAYLRAKGAADDNIRAREALDSTIRASWSSHQRSGTGRVMIADEPDAAASRAQTSPRMLAVLDTPGTGGRTFEAIAGDTPITDAVTHQPANDVDRRNVLNADQPLGSAAEDPVDRVDHSGRGGDTPRNLIDPHRDAGWAARRRDPGQGRFLYFSPASTSCCSDLHWHAMLFGPLQTRPDPQLPDGRPD